jgi:DNA-binding response OmpR family regulator
MAESRTIVCLVDRRRSSLCRALRRAGFLVLETFTTDQTVAVCVSNQVDAVVLHQEFFVEIDGWSVAQSLKLIKANMCVVLASRAPRLNDVPPRAVDLVVPHLDPAKVVEALERLLANQKPSEHDQPVSHSPNPN